MLNKKRNITNTKEMKTITKGLITWPLTIKKKLTCLHVTRNGWSNYNQ